MKQVEVMSPVPGSDEVGRTKHPPALTIKFATFSRKPTPAMMAVGGLPAEMVVHMLVSTRMSPQYGEGGWIVEIFSHLLDPHGDSTFQSRAVHRTTAVCCTIVWYHTMGWFCTPSHWYYRPCRLIFFNFQ